MCIDIVAIKRLLRNGKLIMTVAILQYGTNLLNLCLCLYSIPSIKSREALSIKGFCPVVSVAAMKVVLSGFFVAHFQLFIRYYYCFICIAGKNSKVVLILILKKYSKFLIIIKLKLAIFWKLITKMCNTIINKFKQMST